MSSDERHWVEEAMATCRKASSDGLTIMVARLQDRNDEADIILTNATTPEMVTAMAKALDAELDPE